MNFWTRSIAVMIASIAGGAMSQAAELIVLASQGNLPGVNELATAFARTSGHKVTVLQEIDKALEQRLSNGPADLVTGNPPAMEALLKKGQLVAGTATSFMLAGLGVSVRAGAPKPDISTPEALKRTLLAANSIVYTDPALRSPSGVHFAKVLDRLGIAEEMKAKSKLHNGVGFNAEFVARGEIELAIQQISEIVPVQGVELVGPLPADLQLTTVFATAIGADIKEQGAAKDFVKFLTSPAAAAVIKATGMEPGGL
jgi:molybdate transport system substrate-binding protein